ncbi:sigma-70 family RNA polymerase sigma factor [Aureibaculum marinum]|uniref:Sigma-70 family RNA polymerase sigma factor n=1 Tax=Aureibaculum marinum TaxID=2487930 RepID=A0A3N4N8U5_9FLAO|nr:sigma-70 family RNA polymerase sigma factor [Aureibaculum marinum]RPD91775.1 sigma-70 family RNA polymerase sigma factor [Aureibaculum marinum]
MVQSLNTNVCEERIFSNLFKTLSKDVHNFLRYKYGDNLNPKDKVQEAFIKLWDNCKNVTPEKAKSFLFTTANNMMLNEVKHQKVVLKHQQVKPKDYTNENPEFIMEESEYMKKYQRALGNLTEAQREAFLMNRIEGKKHKEIAEELGISRKGVEKRIYGALEKLRKEIDGI